MIFKNINYEQLSALSIAGIQELKKENDLLKNTVNELSNTLNSVLQRLNALESK